MKKIGVLIAVFILLSSFAFASQEGALKLSSFLLQSEGIGESGSVTVQGTIAETNKIIHLSINAFGKDYKVPDEELEKIPNAFYNGIQLSYEKGYESLGGKNIHIILLSGFTSGIDKRVLISLTENGNIDIQELRE